MLLARIPFVGKSARGASSSADQVPRVLQATGTILFSLSLPHLPPAQRHKAACFALEDHVLEALEPEQVCVGPEFPKGSGRWMVMVLPRADAQQVSRSKTPVLSELMLVEVPPVGWSAVVGDNAVLLRNADGSGTTLPRPTYETWLSARGDAVAAGVMRSASDVSIRASESGVFDLRRNAREDIAYLLERGLVWSLVPFLAVIGTLTFVEYFRTESLEASREAGLKRLATQLDSLGVQSENLIADGSALLSEAAVREESNATFQYLLAEVAKVPFEQLNLSVRSLKFSRSTKELLLNLGGPDLQGLQSAESVLSSDLVLATLGPTEFRDGMAVADLTISLIGRTQ